MERKISVSSAYRWDSLITLRRHSGERALDFVELCGQSAMQPDRPLLPNHLGGSSFRTFCNSFWSDAEPIGGNAYDGTAQQEVFSTKQFFPHGPGKGRREGEDGMWSHEAYLSIYVMNFYPTYLHKAYIHNPLLLYFILTSILELC